MTELLPPDLQGIGSPSLACGDHIATTRKRSKWDLPCIDQTLMICATTRNYDKPFKYESKMCHQCFNNFQSTSTILKMFISNLKHLLNNYLVLLLFLICYVIRLLGLNNFNWIAICVLMILAKFFNIASFFYCWFWYVLWFFRINQSLTFVFKCIWSNTLILHLVLFHVLGYFIIILSITTCFSLL